MMWKKKQLILEPLAVISDNNIPSGYEYQSDAIAIVSPFIEKYKITNEQIEEYQQYFLNEVFLKTWVEGNGKDSKFTLENVGEFTIVDNTFQNIGK